MMNANGFISPLDPKRFLPLKGEPRAQSNAKRLYEILLGAWRLFFFKTCSEFSNAPPHNHRKIPAEKPVILVDFQTL